VNDGWKWITVLVENFDVDIFAEVLEGGVHK
jgi:hypothetical protein